MSEATLADVTVFTVLMVLVYVIGYWADRPRHRHVHSAGRDKGRGFSKRAGRSGKVEMEGGSADGGRGTAGNPP